MQLDQIYYINPPGFEKLQIIIVNKFFCAKAIIKKPQMLTVCLCDVCFFCICATSKYKFVSLGVTVE